MKNEFIDRKMIGLIILSLIITINFPLSGEAIINQSNEKNYYEEKSEWKTATYCMIRGEHYGGIRPNGRLGFAFTIKVYPDSLNDIEIKKDNEYIQISELRGFCFFGIIEWYSIPRIPAQIFGYILYCQYNEK